MNAPELRISEQRIKPALDYGKQRDFPLSIIFHRLSSFNELKQKGLPMEVDTAERYACGYPIPSFQRPPRWDMERKLAYITSIWSGMLLSPFVAHEVDFGHDGKPKKYSGWLIDGQQRLITLEQYFSDEFPVYGLLWSELNLAEKRRFLNIKLPCLEPALWDEEAIRAMYDIINFGGVPHEQHERASQSNR